jgi:2,3-diaminopropionate biosynthesis protein SbnA
MLINKLSDIRSEPILYNLSGIIEHAELYLKLEGLNISGSIKLKTALHVVSTILKQPGYSRGSSKLIASSSGNMGIALSIVCKQESIPFICVTDPNISPMSKSLIKLYGAELVTITKKDVNGGYLGTRLDYINSRCKSDSKLIWVNQYANPANPRAHFETTAPEIIDNVGVPDYLFVGAGTSGTLMGCIDYFQQHGHPTKIIAVEPIGSVSFSYPANRRYIPGIGTSSKPALLDVNKVFDVVRVGEKHTIKMCRELLQKEGLFLGGSSGSVLAAIEQYSAAIESGCKVVAIAPDFGTNYMNMIYDDSWVEKHFPDYFLDEDNALADLCVNES